MEKVNHIIFMSFVFLSNHHIYFLFVIIFIEHIDLNMRSVGF